MKKQFKRVFLLCAMLCLCCAFLGTSALAADGEDVTYVISFRPGAYGSFSPAAEGYLSSFGTVQRSAVGNLFVEVKAGSGFPVGIASYLTPNAGYYYKGGLNGGVVNGDMDFVAEYGIVPSNSVVYSILYVDATTGTEVAEPTIAVGQTGESVTATAKTVQGYAVDTATKTLTVADGAQLRFLYTLQPNYVYGPNNVVVEVVPVAPNGQEQGAQTPENGTDVTPEAPETETGTENETENETENGGETIPGNETPLNPGNETAEDGNAEDPGETIGDEDTPLAPGSGENNGIGTGVVVGLCIGGVALLAALAAYLLRKKVA